jgi:hypothetical protein
MGGSQAMIKCPHCGKDIQITASVPPKIPCFLVTVFIILLVITIKVAVIYMTSNTTL